jgi:CSLREA domain-containing protein
MSARRLLLGLLPLALLLFALQATPAHAATFDVNTTSDGNDFDPGNGVCSINPPAQPIVCTLRAAVQEVNALGGGPHTINLPAGTYQVTLGGNPQLTINANVALVGAGEATTIVDGNGVGGGLFSGCGSGCTSQPKTVSMSGLTIRNAAGTGLTNPGGAGPMTIDHVTVSGNGTHTDPTLRGGGIRNDATMMLTNVTVRDNNLLGSNNTGGILNVGGQSNLTATNLTVTGNRSTSSAGGIVTDNGGFPPGGTLSITGGAISNNASGGGPAGGLSSGGGIVTLTNVTVSGNTNIGAGDAQFGRVGGINATGVLTLSNVAITGNQVTGTPGVGTIGGLGFAGTSLTMTSGSVTGNGGAGANVGGLFYGGIAGTITGTAIQNNSGAVASTLTGGQGGISVNGSGLTITDLTVSGNTGQGNNTAAGLAVLGGSGNVVERATLSGNTGGGLRVEGDVTVRNVTVSGNTGDGVNSTESQPPPNLINVTIASNGGAGIHTFSNSFGPMQVKSTLVANNSGGNCVTPAGRPLGSQGSNLSSDTTCAASFSQAGDQNNVNPLLGPLANNGGLTQTHALLAGSPAIDGVVSGCPPPATDQRGVSRPQGARCDVGAYEAPPACTPRPTVAVTTAPNGVGRLLVTVSASNNATTANNVIRSLRFGEARASTNELIDVEGQTGRSGAFTVAVNPPRAQVSFTLRQQATGSATTVNFVAVDNCGDWQTLAGGGPATFGGPGPASPATPVPTPAGSPPATTSPLPASGLTSSAAPPPVPPTCAPRPALAVTTAPAGDGRLQVTVSTPASDNALQALRFGAAQNAVVEAGGQRGPGNFAVTLPAGTRQTTFTLVRTTAGQGVSVSLTVTDGCGDWPTLVGAGPAAF